MAVPGIQIWRSTKIPDLHHLLAMGRQNADPNRNSRIVPKDVLALVLHEVDSWEWLHNLQGLLQNENSWSWLGAVIPSFLPTAIVPTLQQIRILDVYVQ